MGDSVRFVLPGPPRGKGVARITRFGTFIPKESREEMEAMRQIARIAMGGRAPFTGPVEIKLCAYCPVPESWSRKTRERALSGAIHPTARPDLSNIAKGVEDSLLTRRPKKDKPWTPDLQAVINDDSQVVRLIAWKVYSADPRVVVVVTEIDT